MKKLSIFFTILFSMILIACGEGVNEDLSHETVTCEDVSGKWDVAEVVNPTTCDKETETNFDTYTIAQDDCDITVTATIGIFTGKVNANQISWKGSYPVEEGGRMVITVDLVASGDVINGSASWTLFDEDEDETCSGVTSISGVRQKSPLDEVL